MKRKFILFGFILLIAISILLYAILLTSEINSNKGIVTLTFDDGLKSQYEIAFKEMQKYNYGGSLFLLANGQRFFEDRELMTFEEAREMQNNGWEIGSHTLNHLVLTILSDEEVKEELEKSKELLEDEGFEIKTIAFPFGSYNKEISDETKKYYCASRSMEDGFNPIENLTFYDLKSKWAGKMHSSEEVCSWIKQANDEGVWLILTFHNIGEEQTLWDFSGPKFKEVLECIKDEGIAIKTIKEMLGDEKGV